MARRLVNTTYTSPDQTDWGLELWDMATTSSNLDYIVDMDVNGFEITWSGDENTPLQPLMSSACKFTLIVNETQRGNIMDVAYGTLEFRMCVLIRKNTEKYWCGQIHSEAIIERIEDGRIYVDFTASDGLAQLDNIDFKETDGTVYTDRFSVQSYIYAILKKLPSISLWYTDSGVGSVFMYEHNLNQPVISADSFSFSHTGSDGITRGVLDYLHVDPNTWYLRTQEPEIQGDDFRRYPTTKEDGFVSSKLVLHDMLASLGATICFSQGTWRVFDRSHLDSITTSLDSSSVIQYARTSSGTLEAATFTEDIDVQVDTTTASFRQGIVRKGLQPFRAAAQEHVNAGSDLLYAAGIGYFGPDLAIPLFRFEKGSISTFPSSDATAMFSVAGATGLSGNALIDELAIANGDNGGRLRFHISGNCDYDKFKNSRPAGTMMIFSFVLEIKDSNNVSYRLKRRVRTMQHTSAGVSNTVSINGSSTDYVPKFYESDFYEWVDSTDSGYNTALVDIMLGADPSVLVDNVGESQQFMTQNPEQNSGFAMFTPPGTKIKTIGEDNDNVLKEDNSASKRYFVWRFDQVIDMPVGSANITQVQVPTQFIREWAPDQGPDRKYDSSGSELALGSDLGSANYATAHNINGSLVSGVYTNSGEPICVEMFQYSGIEIYNGDGTNAFNNVSIFTPSSVFGNEIYRSPRTNVGGSFTNTGTHVYGRYLVSSFSDPTAREDNFKMIPAWDSSDTANRMTQRVNKNIMQMRDRTRQIVEGSMFSFTTNSTILEPWQRLLTKKLSGATETFIPFRVTLRFADLDQRLTMMRQRDAHTTITGSHTDDDKGRILRGPVGNDFDPGGLPDIIGPQVASISFNSNNEITGFTVASGFTPINADQISTVGTTNQFGGSGSLFGDLFPTFINRP